MEGLIMSQKRFSTLPTRRFASIKNKQTGNAILPKMVPIPTLNKVVCKELFSGCQRKAFRKYRNRSMVELRGNPLLKPTNCPPALKPTE